MKFTKSIPLPVYALIDHFEAPLGLQEKKNIILYQNGSVVGDVTTGPMDQHKLLGFSTGATGYRFVGHVHEENFEATLDQHHFKFMSEDQQTELGELTGRDIHVSSKGNEIFVINDFINATTIKTKTGLVHAEDMSGQEIPMTHIPEEYQRGKVIYYFHGDFDTVVAPSAIIGLLMTLRP